MAIDPTRLSVPSVEPQPPATRPTTAADALSSFQKVLGEAIGQVDTLQQRADELAVRVATGDEVDLHDAVIAQERAALAFRLTLQVRNKLLEAYHELTRMQV
ncbi:MAG: flagellar hook-basal body complex protein FliE [Chloroflexi bacterium]|nr:flagellar hook-basal body complex protein FliE [Chloroflexota bacterium]